MEKYLVGGAVRDQLLGLAHKERDWVVVGSTPDEMISLGFIPVGKDFPVFLHPETHEEYALARTERKQGHGYKGFTVWCAPEVTLEDDLVRRDLTINAIAQAPDGTLIDPHGGQKDVEQRILRHVSPAFIEDPVRVLRVARLMARLSPLGFKVADETLDLMRKMAQSGELNHLVPERVWQELTRALQEARPGEFISTLGDCEALAVLFPEIAQLFNQEFVIIPRRQGSLGTHLYDCLNNAAKNNTSNEIRFALLLHDVDKVTEFCKRYKVSRNHQELAVITQHHLKTVHHILEKNPVEQLDLLEQVDSFRRPERFKQFLDVCEICGLEYTRNKSYPPKDFLLQAHQLLSAIQIPEHLKNEGTLIKTYLREQRIAALEKNLSI